MAVQMPAAPRLASNLDEWDGVTDEFIEVNDAIVRGADFMSVAKLNVDATRLEAVDLTGAALDRLEMTDSECVRLEGAALRAYKANMLRVRLSESRLTGAEFAEARFEDCTFKNVKFDEAGFRFASFTRVRFENCMLRQADFSNAKFLHVTLTGCDLENASFVSVSCRHVDITTEDLMLVKGLLGLKGATISEMQLMQVAPLLAAELGFHIK